MNSDVCHRTRDAGTRLEHARRLRVAAATATPHSLHITNATNATDTTATPSPAHDGVDVVWTTSGHDDLEREVGLLAHGRWLVLMAGLDQRPPFPVGPFYRKNARATGFTITATTTSELAAAAATINAMLASGTLKTRIARTFPLAEARAAHHLVEGNTPGGEKAKGRVVVIHDVSQAE